MRRTPLLLTALALAATTSTLAAQEGAAAAERRNLLSTNPTLFVAGWYGLEYERRVGTGTTLSVGVSYFEIEDDNESDGEEEYLSADLKLRYYPSERVFRGFSLAASAGAAQVWEDRSPLGDDAPLTALTAGFGIDYGWLLGRRDRVHIGLGAGARRLFYLSEGRVDAFEVLPYLRFSVGVAW